MIYIVARCVFCCPLIGCVYNLLPIPLCLLFGPSCSYLSNSHWIGVRAVPVLSVLAVTDANQLFRHLWYLRVTDLLTSIQELVCNHIPNCGLSCESNWIYWSFVFTQRVSWQLCDWLVIVITTHNHNWLLVWPVLYGHSSITPLNLLHHLGYIGQIGQSEPLWRLWSPTVTTWLLRPTRCQIRTNVKSITRITTTWKRGIPQL